MGRTADRWRLSLVDRAEAMTPVGVRRSVVKARLQTRQRTAPWRALPDVLIIGAQRCGTSSLYKWLGRHPNVAPSLRKEIEYFSTDHAKGESWYRAHFPMTLRRRVATMLGRPLVTFEDTPDYLFDPRAPGRAHALIPDARLIALLRNPADRAVSQYYHNVRLGHEPLDLEAALLAEEDRLGEGWVRIAEGRRVERVLRSFSYVARGRYAEQLERWLELYPRHQLLVLRSEDLFARPGEMYRRILDFLDLPGWEPPEFHAYTDDGDALRGKYPDPPATVRRLLADRLAEANRRLVELLGEEYRWDAVSGRPSLT